ncbi:F-box/kelch-repeat protein [Senna tora]|uniref:F-box/kelch-repeat protein n=1 Tax=Senna tora TaxID=362788 RepID=A0A834U0R1_9FABA|nr:F-box/kelch-repeat protein [Senna tora]
MSNPGPGLVYGNGDQRIVFSLSNPKENYPIKVLSLEDPMIVAHSCGWFLLSQEDTHFSLWNPTISNSFIHLPPLSLDPTPRIKHYLLTSPPGHSDCKVLLFDDVLGSVIFIRPDDEDPHKEWTQVQYAKSVTNSEGEEVKDQYLYGCVSCDGDLYAINYTTQGRELVRLSVERDNNLVIEHLCKMPRVITLSTVGALRFRISKWLVDCCGELLFVYMLFIGPEYKQLSEVHVLKFDSVVMSWKRAESLRGQAVFLDAMGDSTFNPAFGKGVEADSVYFTLPSEKGLYSFNVTDGCLSVTLPCSPVPSSHWGSPMILMPHHSSRNNVLPAGEEEQDKKFDDKKEGSGSAKIVQADDETTSVLDLPLDCQVMIADCLNLFDYRSFRATCRDFRLIPKLQYRQALQRFKRCPSSSKVWLLLSVNDMSAFKFVDPVHGTSFLMSVPESLKGSVVRCSRNGWLLMSDRKSSMSFLNPFTNKIIKLSKTPIECASSYAMAFTSLPTSPDCIVLGCGAFPPTATSSKLRILPATPMGGPPNWIDASIERDAIFQINNSSPVFYKERFYLLGLDGKLSVLKCVHREDDLGFYWIITWDILERLETPHKSFYQNFLLGCDGKLMSIFVGEMGEWLQIYSLDFTEMRWEKVESIGNYVIYVSRSSSVAIEARITGTNNRIYFPRFHDNCILYYSLETRKFHSDGQSTVESFYNTKEPLLATWIEPLCS